MLQCEVFSSCRVQASHCSGFSRRGAQARGPTGSVAAAPGLWSTGSEVVVHGLSCSATCGIFLNQGSNLHLLHWQQIPYHWASREAPPPWFNSCKNFDVIPYKFYKSHHRENLECQGWKTLIENIT